MQKSKECSAEWAGLKRIVGTDRLESLLGMSEDGVSVHDYNADPVNEEWYQEKKFDELLR